MVAANARVCSSCCRSVGGTRIRGGFAAGSSGEPEGEGRAATGSSHGSAFAKMKRRHEWKLVGMELQDTWRRLHDLDDGRLLGARGADGAGGSAGARGGRKGLSHESHERGELARTWKSQTAIGKFPAAAGAGRLSAAPKNVLQLGDVFGHGVLAGRRLRVVAGAKVLAPRGGEVLAVLRVVVVGERLEEHRGNVGPVVGTAIGACCLAKGADVDHAGRKGNVGLGHRAPVVALKQARTETPGLARPQRAPPTCAGGEPPAVKTNVKQKHNKR